MIEVKDRGGAWALVVHTAMQLWAAAPIPDLEDEGRFCCQRMNAWYGGSVKPTEHRTQAHSKQLLYTMELHASLQAGRSSSD